MELNKHKIIAYLWTYAILFYFLRAVFEPLKFLFIASAGLLVISVSYTLITEFRKADILKYFLVTKEFHILGLFLVLGIILSSEIQMLSIKALVNFLGLSMFLFIYFIYKDYIQLIQVFKYWIVFTIIIGLVGFLKWLNYFLGINLDLFNYFFRYGTSLASDYNVYACYFILSIVIYLYAIRYELSSTKLTINLLVLFIFLFNIVLSGSRRGILILSVLLLLSLVYLIKEIRQRHSSFFKNILYLNILILSSLALIAVLIPFRSKIIQEKSSRFEIASSTYRYSTIINPNITFNIHYKKLWPRIAIYENDKTNWESYASYNNFVNGTIKNKYENQGNEFWQSFDDEIGSEGLLYNGDFKYGKEFWGFAAPDTIHHEIISTQYGNALRVSRYEGEGYWPLMYTGRDIIFYNDVTYTFRFKYRVIEGSGVPFCIGWWINEGKGYINNLPYTISALDHGWKEFSASYQFKSAHHHLRLFMNSQRANTIIDFTDIELISDDTLNRPKYFDQWLQEKGINLLYNGNFENELAFWDTSAPDSIRHELIETRYGKAVRVIRKEGSGYWPLVYNGRDIFYYKDQEYFFRFKFRVIKGSGIPFNIGWWLPEEGHNPYDLNKNILPLQDQWYECIASYTFNKDQYSHIPTFMNSQQSNTIIDFADIELLCTDSLDHPMFADEMIGEIEALEGARIKEQMELENSTLLSDRKVRWQYAYEIWNNEYTLQQKVFGGGFDYLKKFGQKFYPDMNRVDYPHNPILSAFLFSGVLGGAIYIYFLTLSFWYYWKYRKHHMLFFILYLIYFSFIFISSNSHFNVPIFACLSLVPFITRSIIVEKNKG